MKRLSILLYLTLLAISSIAAPVDVKTARIAGIHFLQRKSIIDFDKQLTPYSVQNPFEGFYIFNIDTTGFVIVSADDRCMPILGYSTNGCFHYDKIPTNFKSWLEDCSESIQKGILANAPENKAFNKMWKELMAPPSEIQHDAKSDSYLLESTWEQGYGYNNYCPTMNGQHVVVGCIATAMAQIIRYYGYPTRGFGRKSYIDPYHGLQSVDFDTSEYDYSLMPAHLSRSSSAEEQDMVSRLCYHCGVVTNMTYQSPDHTTGSGSYTERVPDGLTYFGYTTAQCFSRSFLGNDSLWDVMIRNEIDNLRPIEYSGAGDGGGHAFVLDGYNNNSQYHFNWGWGGYCDGFYTLSTMVGFTSNHQMVTGIYPSGWDGHLTQFHVSPDGHGNGTSWEQSNSDIKSALLLSKMTGREIWLKEGIYYGDTAADYAFNFTYPATIIGGFEGTETSISQHNPKNHPSILSGQGLRSVLNARCSSNNPELKISHLIIQDGYSVNSPSVNLSGNVTARQLTLRNNRADSNHLINITNSSNLIASTIYNNEAPTICLLDEGSIRQSLIHNNNGDILVMRNNSQAVNCDIVSNLGVGAIFKRPTATFVNNIVWNNETSVQFDTTLNNDNFRHCAVQGESLVEDSTNIWLNSENDDPKGPRFIHPSTTKGITGFDSETDWFLMRGSICINAGERLSGSISDGDLNGSLRSRQGLVDIGCYETNYPVGIDTPQSTKAINVYPNPATNTIIINNCTSGKIQLFDITGHKVIETASKSSTLTLDISQLPQGVYFLKSETGTAKVLKH